MAKHEFNRIFDMLNKNAANSGNKKSSAAETNKAENVFANIFDDEDIERFLDMDENEELDDDMQEDDFDESYAEELAGALYQLEVMTCAYALALAVKEVEKATGMDAGQFGDMCLAVAREEVENMLQNEMDKEWDKK